MEKNCKHCKQSFTIDDKPKGWMANHSRWCKSNPKRVQYVDKLSKARESIGTEARLRQAKKLSERHKEGLFDHIDRRTFLGKKHTEQSKRKMSESALRSKHRRLKKGVVVYKGIILDSTWELTLAQRLDELNITWVRPDPIPWIDERGTTHNYFPDFYLPHYNLYLDPKNPHARKVQTAKLDQLQRQYSNIRIIESYSECANFCISDYLVLKL